jgi:hypothetical protein
MDMQIERPMKTLAGLMERKKKISKDAAAFWVNRRKDFLQQLQTSQ